MARTQSKKDQQNHENPRPIAYNHELRVQGVYFRGLQEAGQHTSGDEVPRLYKKKKRH